MDATKQKQYEDFLEHKDEMIESLTEDISNRFKENPESIWSFFTPAHELAKEIRTLGGVVTDEWV